MLQSIPYTENENVKYMNLVGQSKHAGGRRVLTIGAAGFTQRLCVGNAIDLERQPQAVTCGREVRRRQQDCALQHPAARSRHLGMGTLETITPAGRDQTNSR